MPAIGEVIAGRYRLEQELGAGNVGWVFRATHLTLASDVAIKILKHNVTDMRSRARFEREALLAAKLRSDHVVRVIDHGEHEALPFMVMEHLAGEDLRRRLHVRGRLGLEETAAIVMQVCRGLSAAHQLGLVHRDIKPENIFLRTGEDGGEDRVVVLDFGVAKVTDAMAGDGFDPTQTGAVIGTPYYLSPEQARGDKTLGPAADLWSLAVVAFECLTGERPFVAPALGPLIAKILYGAIPLPSQVTAVPEAVDAWFAQALAREPAQRFASARDMARVLAAAMGMQGPSSFPAPALPQPRFEPRPQPKSQPRSEPRPEAQTPRLVLWRGQALEHTYPVLGDARIGRGAECEISIAHHTLSREHALVRAEDGMLSVRDLGSKNGTFVNDRRLDAPHPLHAGDRLRCGGLTFEVVVPAAPSTPAVQSEDVPTIRPTSSVRIDPGRALLEACAAAAGERGVDARTEAILDLAGAALSASRAALIAREGRGWRTLAASAAADFGELPDGLDDTGPFARGAWMGAPVRAGATRHGMLLLQREGVPDLQLAGLLQAFADLLALSLSRT